MADIVVDEDYFNDIYKKSLLYDKMIESRRMGATVTNNISPSERIERAKKAAAARWNKK